ncbi:hypothetical protein D9M71_723250 [compost metagenome]
MNTNTILLTLLVLSLTFASAHLLLQVNEHSQQLATLARDHGQGGQLASPPRLP